MYCSRLDHDRQFGVALHWIYADQFSDSRQKCDRCCQPASCPATSYKTLTPDGEGGVILASGDIYDDSAAQSARAISLAQFYSFTRDNRDRKSHPTQTLRRN